MAGGLLEAAKKNVRTVLYVTALTGIRHNPAIKAFYNSLIERGKPKKVAITACMRKILVTLNAMARTNTVWSLKESVLTD
jgi:transposase